MPGIITIYPQATLPRTGGKKHFKIELHILLSWDHHETLR